MAFDPFNNSQVGSEATATPAAGGLAMGCCCCGLRYYPARAPPVPHRSLAEIRYPGDVSFSLRSYLQGLRMQP